MTFFKAYQVMAMAIILLIFSSLATAMVNNGTPNLNLGRRVLSHVSNKQVQHQKPHNGGKGLASNKGGYAYSGGGGYGGRYVNPPYGGRYVDPPTYERPPYGGGRKGSPPRRSYPPAKP